MHPLHATDGQYALLAGRVLVTHVAFDQGGQRRDARVRVHAETPLPVCVPAPDEVEKYERLQDLTQVAWAHKQLQPAPPRAHAALPNHCPALGDLA